VQIAAGGYHSCALIKGGYGGYVVCWGSNVEGQLGLGPLYGRVSGRFPPKSVIDLVEVKQIAVGWKHSCAILESGRVACWGDNSHGQTGAGDPQQGGPAVLWEPRLVKQVEKAAELALGYGHTCVRTEDDKLTCWGDGFSCKGPARVKQWGSLRRIAAGGEQTCIEQANGTISCAENNHFHGDPDACLEMDDRMKLLPVPNVENVIDLRLGGTSDNCARCFACALRQDRTVACWGYHGATLTSLTDIVQISAGASHACAVRADHRVFCWGDGNYGQLGDGGRPERPTPVEPVWTPGATP
jgi:hypothetical protein